MINMLINLLFLVGLSLVIVSYGRIFISYFRNRKNIENDLTGFDVAKEITFNYVLLYQKKTKMY